MSISLGALARRRIEQSLAVKMPRTTKGRRLNFVVLPSIHGSNGPANEANFSPRSRCPCNGASGCSWLLSWLLLAAPGCFPCCSWMFLAAPSCSWLLLAAPRCSWLRWAASGCSWLLLAAPGATLKTRFREGVFEPLENGPIWGAFDYFLVHWRRPGRRGCF